jgi:hypothetical protein
LYNIYIYVRGEEGGRKHKEALNSEDIAMNTVYLLVVKKTVPSIEQCNAGVISSATQVMYAIYYVLGLVN